MKRNKTIHSEQYSNLIEKLCQERMRLGLSQAEVASCLKMTQSDISKIETGERRLDILEFKVLLKAYRIKENKKLNKLVVEFFELER
jgi:transcriptional regulator with XRE-family HTH domain